jgi:hypothetical protein
VINIVTKGELNAAPILVDSEARPAVDAIASIVHTYHGFLCILAIENFAVLATAIIFIANGTVRGGNTFMRSALEDKTPGFLFKILVLVPVVPVKAQE